MRERQLAKFVFSPRAQNVFLVLEQKPMSKERVERVKSALRRAREKRLSRYNLDVSETKRI